MLNSLVQNDTIQLIWKTGVKMKVDSTWVGQYLFDEVAGCWRMDETGEIQRPIPMVYIGDKLLSLLAQRHPQYDCLEEIEEIRRL